MSVTWDGMLGFVIYSSMVVLTLLMMVFVFRQYLIKKNTSRSTVLKVWLALPVGLASCFVFSNNGVPVVDLAPMVIAVKAPVEQLGDLTPGFDWKKLLVLTWGAVALWKMWRLRKQYNKIKQRIADEYKLFSDGVFVSPSGWPPMAFGFIKPKIFLPGFVFKELSGNDIKLLVMHEKIHCQRADPFWRLCLEGVCCVFWFLPLHRIWGQLLVEDQEMSCDEKVINNTQDAPAYAHLLLNLGVRSPQNRGSSMMCSYTLKLKERIMNINQIKQQRHKSIFAGIFCLTAVALGAVAGMPEPSRESGAQLEVLERVAPRYPLSAYQKKLNGVVELNFLVTQSGQVKEVKVTASEPAGVFDKAAIAAIKQWTFEPLAQDTHGTQVMEFKMD
ncbi:M56 family metallopeptidase [Marinicella rhabdoformis]|uniref:M56 family metallopeptidase n=1 Tax=Marinicella rhabdoformis TaxID=2580566 RepID=UPI0012AEC061|nr:M56 family metallopeptidase [Marinicella rhabdoformis]